MHYNKKIDCLIYYMYVLAMILAFVVVGLGVYTRLVHAGLGCPDWPGCYGFFMVPETPAMMDLAQQRFPFSPVEPVKGWVEMIHRYVAGSLICFVFLINIISIRYRAARPFPIKLGIFILVLLAMQALFGMWTVTLKLWPQVVTAHLLGGVLTLALLFIMILRLSSWTLKPLFSDEHTIKIRVISGITLCIIVVQIILGGWLSANYAAMACPDFPLCQGQWWPEMNFINGFNMTQSIGPNYLGGQLDNTARVAIHMAHRLWAGMVALSVLLLLGFMWFKHLQNCISTQSVVRYSIGMGGLLVLQIGLGISNILFYLPLKVAILHHFFGIGLLLSLIALNYHLYIVRPASVRFIKINK